MCELFGFSGTEEKDLTSLLKEFFTHSIDHPNGWGLCDIAGSLPVPVTEPVPAYKSRLLPGLLAGSVRSRRLIAHIRRATIGNISINNCHPFTLCDKTGRQWTFMHNGTMFNGLELLKYKRVQQGTTDSERVLLYLIDCINEATDLAGRPLSDDERFDLLQKAVSSIAFRNKLNLIFFDGSLFYVHCNMKDTLYSRRSSEGTLFSTVPLDSEVWTPLPLCTLQAYRDGELVLSGEPHGKEFVDALSSALDRLDFTI